MEDLDRKISLRFSTFTAGKADAHEDLAYVIYGEEYYKALVDKQLNEKERIEFVKFQNRQHYISKGMGFFHAYETVELEEDDSLNQIWRPKANITYSQMEGINPTIRLDKIASFTNESQSPDEEVGQETPGLEVQKAVTVKNYYSHDTARLSYIGSKPTCFVILGKGGIGEIALGKLLANLWKCVYIDPETVIQDEVKNKSKEGLCLEYSLKLGRSLHPDIIMKLIEKRVRSREVQHRGYVIVGIPIIPSDLVEPIDATMVTESTVFTVEKTVHEMMEGAIIEAAINYRDKRLQEEEEKKEQEKLLALEKATAKKEVVEEEVEEEEENEGEELGEGEEEGMSITDNKVEDDYTIIPEPTEFNQENLYRKGSSSNISVVMDASKFFCPEDTTKSQLLSLFSLPYKPDVIIYISCPDEDVIIKRSMCECYDDANAAICSDIKCDIFDAATEGTSDMSFHSEDHGSYASEESEINNNNLEEEVDDAPKVTIKAIKEKNDPISVRIQIDRYRLYALPIIEKYMLLHDPQYIIRVDGRTTLADMFDTTSTRLRTLPLQQMFVPQRFFEPAKETESSEKVVTGEGGPDEGGAEEGEPEDLGGEDGPRSGDMFFGLSPNECLTKLCTMMKLSPLYDWLKSDWTTYCPVLLKEGKLLTGNPQLAVKYMDRVYMMSSEEAVEKFITNPRKYLLPPQPKPGCRIFMFGPNHSGKSVVAEFLSYLYNGHVITIEDLKFSWRKRKIFRILFERYELEFIKARDIVTERRKEEGKRLEEERKEKILAFKAEIVSYIKELFTLRKFAGDCVNVNCDCCTCRYSKPQHTLAEIMEIFESRSMPFFHDLALCLRIKLDNNLLNEYIPEDIANPIPEPEEVQFNDDDVVEIVIAGLKDPTEVDLIQIEDEDYGPMLAEAIRLADQKRCEETNNKIKYGGWIIDSVPFVQSAWEELYDEQLFADDVIILRDEDTENKFIQDKLISGRYKKFRDYVNLFLELDNESAAGRCPSVHSTASSTYYAMYDLFSSIIDKDAFDSFDTIYQDNTVVNIDYSDSVNIMLEAFKQHLIDFEEKYLKCTQFLHDLYLEPVIVNINNKRDVELMECVMLQLRSKYKQKAYDYKEENVEQELKNIAAEIENDAPPTEPVQIDEGAEDMVAGEEEGEDDDLKLIEHRRLGETNKYCPVIYNEYKILWPGMEQYMIKFYGKIYLFSSEKAKEKFMQNPYTYAPFDKHPTVIPPLRICIVGTYGSGKTTTAKQIARNFGLHYICYMNLLNRLYFPEPLPGREHTKWFIEAPTGEELTITDTDEAYESIQKYINESIPLDPDKVIKALHSAWFREPYLSEGFVLDGFPFRASDVAPLLECCAIPDVFVELVTSADQVQMRMFDRIYQDWLQILNERREARNDENTKIITEYTKIRGKIFKSEFRKLKKQKYEEQQQEAALAALAESMNKYDEEEGDYVDELAGGESNKEAGSVKLSANREDNLSEKEIQKRDSRKSITDDIYQSIVWDTMDTDIVRLNQRIDDAYPMPIINTEDDPSWETEQNARIRIAQQIESWYEVDHDALYEIKEHILEHSIPWIQIQTNNRLQSNIFNEIMFKLLPYKNRSQSFFERTYLTTLEKAETLANNGYYLISRFGKMCPVQLHEGVNPIQMFLPLEMKNEIYPVIHRQYIYFLAGQTNMQKFRVDPLSYINAKNETVPLYPIKISIIGPPKCGKTTLAQRFAKEFAVKVINKADSVAYVLDNLAWTRLAMDINEEQAVTSNVTVESVLKAVIAAASDKHCITQGFILDGFPDNVDELEELVMGDIIPYLFIDLRANLQLIMERNSECSCLSLSCVYDGWCIDQPQLRYFIDEEYQNIVVVDASQSKWEMWAESRDAVCKSMMSIQHYCNRIIKELPANLEYLCISPYEFQHRVGEYKTYCPVCYGENEILTTSFGVTPDRKGLIQYLNSYYWVCDNHITLFLDDAEHYLPPYNVDLPSDLPRRPTADDDRSEWREKLYGEGYDLVEMTDSQPSRVMILGSEEHALMYKDQVYYFVNEQNLNKFLQKPGDYFDKMCDFQAARPLPDLECSTLPVLGYLQQTQTVMVTKAVLAAGRLRPKYPGLDAIISASVYMGYFLKVNNPETPPIILEKFVEAMNRFLAGLDWLKEKVDYFKKNVNPFVRLPGHMKKPEPIPRPEMFVPRLPPECYKS